MWKPRARARGAAPRGPMGELGWTAECHTTERMANFDAASYRSPWTKDKDIQVLSIVKAGSVKHSQNYKCLKGVPPQRFFFFLINLSDTTNKYQKYCQERHCSPVQSVPRGDFPKSSGLSSLTGKLAQGVRVLARVGIPLSYNPLVYPGNQTGSELKIKPFQGIQPNPSSCNIHNSLLLHL